MSGEMRVALREGIAAIDAEAWNACVGGDYPFARYEFLKALEASGSVSEATGWTSIPLCVEQGDMLAAVMPLYLKTHSWGEYVFDQEWAHAYQRHGLAYYPKLLTAIPFSPVTGPRLLVNKAIKGADELDAIHRAALHHLGEVLAQRQLSGWHCLFPDQSMVDTLIHCPALLPDSEHLLASNVPQIAIRHGCQFHWFNRDYRSFDDFLARFSSRKRKNVKKERQAITDQGLVLTRVEGREMGADDWQQFYCLYADTYHKRGHQPHLRASFFTSIGATMPENILVDWALYKGQRVAAAFFLKDSETLYGRYWGCVKDFHALHFEACFYRGIEYCIDHKLKRFDPGAQGEHKISRGFEPVITKSAHWIMHPGFRPAIAEFLKHEQPHIAHYQREAATLLPFKCTDN